MLFSLLLQSALAASFVVSGGGVETRAIGRPSFIKINGKGTAPEGRLHVVDGRAQGEFEFELASLDTGISLRNEHMLEKYLEVGKYPKAKLALDPIEVRDRGEIPFRGRLTLHGETRPVEGKVALADSPRAQASFRVKLSDFRIDVPKYMGITVADEVDVVVTIDKLAEAL